MRQVKSGHESSWSAATSKTVASIATRLVASFLCVLAAGAGLAAESAKVDSAPAGPPVAGVTATWTATVQQRIAASEYHASWQTVTDLPGIEETWQAPNRAHNFRTYFTGEGIRVLPRTTAAAPAATGMSPGPSGAERRSSKKPAGATVKAGRGSPSWEWSLRLSEWGRPGSLVQAPSRGTTTRENRVEYDRGPVIEWFVNDPRGLEQGFRIAAPPRSRNDSTQRRRARQGGALADQGTVVLDLALTGNLRPSVSSDGQAVDFMTADGVRVIHYGSLHVTDASGRALPAHMEGVVRPGLRGIRIAFDDRDALYPVTVDPLATSPAWSAEGDQAGAELGRSTATAGDVNGDGYSDVIVGAPNYDGGEFDEGRVYVYMGTPSGVSGAPSWTAEVNQEDIAFGISVSTAGDVNGDGYSDVIVGSRDGNAAYVYAGSSTGLGESPYWVGTSNQPGSYYGASVSTAGDVNGDGYSDVIVGAFRYDDGPTDEGWAFVYYGSSSGLSPTAGSTVQGNQEFAFFGSSVATAGDVNGDGYADVIVGAWAGDGTLEDSGRAYVYLGSANGLVSTAAWTGDGDQAGDRYGVSVGTAGDVNGDGYSDVIVGAPGHDAPGPDQGAAYVYHGSAQGVGAAAAWVVLGQQNAANLGSSVATAGDVNGDGYSDVLVGAPGHDIVGTDEGAAFLYLGSESGLSPIANWTAEGNQDGAQLGSAVATAGDVNGDGYSDVLIGAPAYDAAESDAGRVSVYLGAPMGLSATAGWESTQAGNYGAVLATAGDVNGDGYADVLIGEPSGGIAFLHLGSATGLSLTPSWNVSQTQGNEQIPKALGTAGDVNGDGYSDVVFSAIMHDIPGLQDVGAVWVHMGSAGGLAATPAWYQTGTVSGEAFGSGAASAGDVNGDGYGDLIVTAANYSNGENQEGKAFLYLGSPTGLGTTPAWSYETNQQDARLDAAASAGDVNGDGFSDVILGAWGQGSARVFYGSPSGLASAPDWVRYGPPHFGAAVNTAGDVNGDGYSDVIVSTFDFYQYAAIFLGSSTGLSMDPSWEVSGTQFGGLYGVSIGSAGDVNGDGYSDIIVGAPNEAHGETSEGRAYLYLGSASGPSTTPSWFFESNGQDARLGTMASAGDVNGDGYADVIVGPGTYAIAAHNYLFYGNGSPGVSLRAQQRRADGTAPVVRMASSGEANGFRVSVLGRSPFGRGKLRLEIETKPHGAIFDGALTSIGSNLDSGVGGAAMNERITTPLSSLEHWRVRLRHDAATTPFLPHGRWLTVPWGGWNESMIRTSGPLRVTATDDTDDGQCTSAHCSLREAIEVWNASGAPGTISLPTAGIVTLTSALPTVTGTLTIEGPAEGDLVLRRDDNAPPFTLLSVAASGTMTLKRLTLENGLGTSAGSAIENAGSVTIESCNLIDNHGGLAPLHGASGSTTTVTASNLWSNTGTAGAISSEGSFEVSGSSFSENTGTETGAIRATAGGQIRRSTFSHNIGGTAGAVSFAAASPSAVVAIESCTFAYNFVTETAQTAGAIGLFDLTEAGSVTYKNSIFSDNSTPSIADHSTDSAVQSLGYNLASDAPASLVHVSDHPNTDAEILPLDNYRGTPSHALPDDSPAVDAGSCAESADQRGAFRRYDAPASNADDGCDIGAVEFVECKSVMSGSWTEASTWDCGIVPSRADDIQVMPGHTVFFPDETSFEAKTRIPNFLALSAPDVLTPPLPAPKARPQAGNLEIREDARVEELRPEFTDPVLSREHAMEITGNLTEYPAGPALGSQAGTFVAGQGEVVLNGYNDQSQAVASHEEVRAAGGTHPTENRFNKLVVKKKPRPAKPQPPSSGANSKDASLGKSGPGSSPTAPAAKLNALPPNVECVTGRISASKATVKSGCLKPATGSSFGQELASFGGAADAGWLRLDTEEAILEPEPGAVIDIWGHLQKVVASTFLHNGSEIVAKGGLDPQQFDGDFTFYDFTIDKHSVTESSCYARGGTYYYEEEPDPGSPPPPPPPQTPAAPKSTNKTEVKTGNFCTCALYKLARLVGSGGVFRAKCPTLRCPATATATTTPITIEVTGDIEIAPAGSIDAMDSVFRFTGENAQTISGAVEFDVLEIDKPVPLNATAAACTNSVNGVIKAGSTTILSGCAKLATGSRGGMSSSALARKTLTTPPGGVTLVGANAVLEPLPGATVELLGHFTKDPLSTFNHNGAEFDITGDLDQIIQGNPEFDTLVVDKPSKTSLAPSTLRGTILADDAIVESGTVKPASGSRFGPTQSAINAVGNGTGGASSNKSALVAKGLKLKPRLAAGTPSSVTLEPEPGASIDLYGDLEKDPAATFTHNGSEFVAKGELDQLIIGEPEFDKLTIDKTPSSAALTNPKVSGKIMANDTLVESGALQPASGSRFGSTLNVLSHAPATSKLRLIRRTSATGTVSVSFEPEAGATIELYGSFEKDAESVYSHNGSELVALGSFDQEIIGEPELDTLRVDKTSSTNFLANSSFTGKVKANDVIVESGTLKLKDGSRCGPISSSATAAPTSKGVKLRPRASALGTTSVLLEPETGATIELYGNFEKDAGALFLHNSSRFVAMGGLDQTITGQPEFDTFDVDKTDSSAYTDSFVSGKIIANDTTVSSGKVKSASGSQYGPKTALLSAAPTPKGLKLQRRSSASGAASVSFEPDPGAVIELYGNFVKSDDSTFTHNGSEIVAKGSFDQIIEGEFTFYDFTVDKDLVSATVAHLLPGDSSLTKPADGTSVQPECSFCITTVEKDKKVKKGIECTCKTQKTVNLILQQLGQVRRCDLVEDCPQPGRACPGYGCCRQGHLGEPEHCCSIHGPGRIYPEAPPGMVCCADGPRPAGTCPQSGSGGSATSGAFGQEETREISIEITGNVFVSPGATFDATDTTVRLTGSSPQIIEGSPTFGVLEIDKESEAATVTITVPENRELRVEDMVKLTEGHLVAGRIDIEGDLVNEGGVLRKIPSEEIKVKGILAKLDGAQFELQGGELAVDGTGVQAIFLEGNTNLDIDLTNPAGVIMKQGDTATGTSLLKMCSSKVRMTHDNGGDRLAAHCGSLHADVDTGPVDILLGADDSITVTVPNDSNVVTDEVSSGVFEIANDAASANPVTVNNGGNVSNLPPGAETVCCEAGCGFLDGDSDGRADVCDCNPSNPTAFGLPEVLNVEWTDNATLSWTSMIDQAGTGTVYQIVRGDLADLPVGSGPSEVCAAASATGTTSSDLTVPPAGTGFYYLVRTSNACGRGSYGTTSIGQPRLSSSCP